MLDLRQTLEYSKYMDAIGWVAERKNRVNYFIKKIPFIGSFIKTQRPENIDFDQLNKIAKNYRAFQIVIEPLHMNQVSSVRYHGYKQNKAPLVPAKTIHIDLNKSERQLLKEMHYKTRYNIVKTQNSKLRIQNSQNAFSFAEFWQECARKQRGMFLSQTKEIIKLHNAFSKKAHIIECFFNNRLVSGILLIQTKGITYYMYAASSNEGKELFAPTLCVWESIKYAKKIGCKVYDFEGIYDERFPLKSWKGFTRFKKSFGGKEIIYPGAFVKYRLPI